MRMKYDEFKFDMKYTKDYIYINCLLSYDWCLKYIIKEIERYIKKNMIISMIIWYRLIYHE